MKPLSVCCVLSLALTLWLASTLAAQDPFAAGVRPTDPLSPADEQKALVVPDGFEVQLVAAEPDILKPMNMAFDERGRMWITNSIEYPWAAPLDKPARDSVKILHDTDGDGRADVIKTFADGLNIPIGIYPYPSRVDDKTGKTIQGAIVFSIPFIWDLRDTDGDDVCDERIKLYGPFGYERDTHGMCNAFRRGFDGWIYACHGFNNISKVTGTDGHVVEMHSGNTFRFRMDGSRIEHFSHGQVNPFGMCFDPLFNIFTADCHTKPVTQILRGGYYQSFGKPHDGLGFVPEIMQHTHGATANCGIVAYYGGHFPKDWEGKFFTGNVMTSRVNVDAPEYHGSTILAKERNDFVISKDPWFRPVDLQCGPDGALYIADFYNKIIGHYEVDLKHPGRDRHRGRIWRVIHKATPPFKMPDLRTAKKAELIELLGHANFKVRSLAFERLSELTTHSTSNPDGTTSFAVDQELVAAFREVLANSKNPHARSMAYALLDQSTETDESEIITASEDTAPEVRTIVLKLIAEMGDNTNEFLTAAIRKRLADDNPFVRRAAADALGKAPSPVNLAALLTTNENIAADDSHLRQAVRIAIRDCLAKPRQFEAQASVPLDEGYSRQLTEFALAIKTAEAAGFVIGHLKKYDEPPETLLPLVQHAARYADTKIASQLVGIVRKRFANDVQQQLGLLSTLRVALQQRGESPDASLRDWASELASKLLESSHGASLSWANEVVSGKPKADNPWELRARVSQDGDKGSLFFDSLVKGEQLTGLYRSEPFELPAKLSFWCAGHNGLPGAPFNPKNYIRLRDASTHALLREAMPPRNDTAQRIEWDLAEFVVPPSGGTKGEKTPEKTPPKDGTTNNGTPNGQRGYIEILDADEGNAYAWLAVGRFSVESLNPSRVVDQQIAAMNLIVDFRLQELWPKLVERLTAPETDSRVKYAALSAMFTLKPDPILAALTPALAEPSISDLLRARVVNAVTQPEAPTEADKLKLLQDFVRVLPERSQLPVAEALSSDPAGVKVLLRLTKDGLISARVLTRPTVKQRLTVLRSEDLKQQYEQLISALPDENKALQSLMHQRGRAYLTAQMASDVTQRPSLEAGATLFTKHCSACHQLGGKGNLVGPQLDGIGQRGLERVLEDVLDPNRNVDVNFRSTTITTKEGKVITGLLRREEGATLILVDNKGKEFTVPLVDIDERAKSNLSLMPANVAEVLTEREFLDLLSFLLSQRQARERLE